MAVNRFNDWDPDSVTVTRDGVVVPPDQLRAEAREAEEKEARIARERKRAEDLIASVEKELDEARRMLEGETAE